MILSVFVSVPPVPPQEEEEVVAAGGGGGGDETRTNALLVAQVMVRVEFEWLGLRRFGT